MKSTTRIGVGGPVGSGKTALVEAITPQLIDMGLKVLIITNDVVTSEDAKHVQRTLKGVLAGDRIVGVETGACPHTAVREDPSMNLAAVDETAGDDYAAVRRASLSDMAGFAPMADILASVHVRSHIRMFMN